MKPKSRISSEDVNLPSGGVLAEADFDRLALEAENAIVDFHELTLSATRHFLE